MVGPVSMYFLVNVAADIFQVIGEALKQIHMYMEYMLKVRLMRRVA